MARLRLVTANVLHGMTVGPDANGSAAGVPGPLAAALAQLGADVLGMQEVDHGQERSGGADQTRDVAAALEAPWWRFVPTVHGTPGLQRTWRPATDEDAGLAGHDIGAGAGAAGPDVAGPGTYGVGLVSRLPVHRWAVRRFAAAPMRLPLLVPGPSRPGVMLVPDEPRVALAAVVEGPTGPFSVVTTHLSFVPGFNVRQLRAIVAWARAELPAPRFLLGDLNLPGGVPARLSGWSSLAHTPSYPSWRPKVQLDHVLGDGLEPWSVMDAHAALLGVSDHRAVVVDVATELAAD